MSTRNVIALLAAIAIIAAALVFGPSLIFSVSQQPVQSSSALPLQQTSTESVLLDNNDDLHVVSVEDKERGVVCYVAYAEQGMSGDAANPSINCLVLPAN